MQLKYLLRIDDKSSMKKLMLITVLFVTSSCASMAPISYSERCAIKGMKFVGTTESHGYGSATAYNFQTGQSATAHSYSHGESLSCAVPQNDLEACEVESYRAGAIPKVRYNSDYTAKYYLTLLGYYALIVPGVLAKSHFDAQLADAMKESSQAIADAKSCERNPASDQ